MLFLIFLAWWFDSGCFCFVPIFLFCFWSWPGFLFPIILFLNFLSKINKRDWFIRHSMSFHELPKKVIYGRKVYISENAVWRSFVYVYFCFSRGDLECVFSLPMSTSTILSLLFYYTHPINLAGDGCVLERSLLHLQFPFHEFHNFAPYH